MSHVGSYDTGLTCSVDKNLMALALAAVASAVGGEAVVGKNAEVKNTYGQKTKVEMAITTAAVPTGVGLSFGPQGPKFVLDTWGRQEEAKSLQDQITQAYVSLAATAAVKRMGFNSKVKSINKIISIDAER